jgi:hypothetical protein
VAYVGGEIFRAAARVTGPEVPEGFPSKYTVSLQKVDFYNASMSWDVEELSRWQGRHGIRMEEGPVALFESYRRSNHLFATTLVEHPGVVDPARYQRCSVVLQRGVIVFDDGVETLFLRPYFHSARDSENFVNFVPHGGIKVSFASDDLWFPLELTGAIQEPASYVVLDILTTHQLDARQLPRPFRLEKTGLMEYHGTIYNVARVTAVLSRDREWPDLRLPVQTGKVRGSR